MTAQPVFGISFALLMALLGYRKRAVSLDGAIAGFIVGIFSCVFAGYRGAAVLFIFFFSSSILTRLKGKLKKQLEHGHKKGGQRNWVQVFSNSLAGNICALLFLYSSVPNPIYDLSMLPEVPIDLTTMFWPSFWMIGYLAHYACCNGDTWASEIGLVMGSSQPLLLIGINDHGGLILGKRVHRGTNGAISLVGTIASFGGGVLVGIFFAVASWLLSSGQYSFGLFIRDVLLGGFSGVIGSLIDSVLGGTLQRSWWDPKKKQIVEDNSRSKAVPPGYYLHVTGLPILDNHQVNLLSSLVSALTVPLLCLVIL